jgi:hypothetical protein
MQNVIRIGMTRDTGDWSDAVITETLGYIKDDTGEIAKP